MIWGITIYSYIYEYINYQDIFIGIYIILLPSDLKITVIYFVYPDLDLPRIKPSQLKQTHHVLGDKYWGDCV